MPPSPEVRRVSGQKWAREIKRKLETKQLGATTSDVGVTRKIEKHLEGNGETARPRSQPPGVGRRVIEIRIRDHGEAIGESEKYLFVHPRRNELPLDAGNPEGVGNDQPRIGSCSPDVTDAWGA